MLARQRRYTPEDLIAMPDGDRYELLDGQLVALPTSMLASLVGGELFCFVANFCKTHGRGHVWHANLPLRCFPDAPDTVRKPKMTFIRQGRLSAREFYEDFCRVPPDLVAEVGAPTSSFEDLDLKVDEYLRAGVRLVWVVSLKTRLVYIHRLDGSITKVRENEELTGEDVLPGFRCLVNTLFPKIEAVEPA